MADIRFTKQRLAEHWRYARLRYLIWAVVTLIGVDLLFSVTAYRPPEDKKLQLYLCNGYADADALQQALWPALHEACPEQEELTAFNIDLLSDDAYTQIQFTTYLGAQEGDVMLLPKSQARQLAQDGVGDVFLDLTPYVQSGLIPTQGIDLTAGKLQDEQGGIYAIPADTLLGLLDYRCNPTGAVLVIMRYNGNDDAAATLLGQMVARFEDHSQREVTGEGTRIFQ